MSPQETQSQVLSANAELDLLGSEVRGRLSWLAKATRRLDLPASEWLPVHHRVRRDGGLFREHRSYEPGDELRHIDWNVYARRRELVSKLYDPDERGRYGVLVDLSGSVMAAGNERWKTALLLAAGLGTVALHQGNSLVLIGVARAGGVRIHQHEHPAELGAFLRELDELPRGGSGGLEEVPGALAPLLHPPGAWIVVSDYFPRDDLEAFLRRLGGRPALLIHPIESGELEPLGRGLRRIADPESARRRWILVTRAVARRYAELVREHRREVHALARTHGAACFDVETRAPFDRTLVALLRQLVARRRWR